MKYLKDLIRSISTNNILSPKDLSLYLLKFQAIKNGIFNLQKCKNLTENHIGKMILRKKNIYDDIDIKVRLDKVYRKGSKDSKMENQDENELYFINMDS